jgi:hypothetical protein
MEDPKFQFRKKKKKNQRVRERERDLRSFESGEERRGNCRD